MRYIVIHDDDIPGTFKELLSNIDGMTDKEILADVQATLTDIKHAKEHKKEYLKDVYGDE